jgi:serine/threonine protein kinase
MSDACPECGKPVGPNALQGLCPDCMMKVGLGSIDQSHPLATGAAPPGKAKAFVAPTVPELAPMFPQLEILSLIGQGGMGAVYEARQKELDRIVALKILPPGIGQDAAFADRFTREAKALARLNHPGIVTLYEFGRADGLFYFQMEYVDGMSLRQLLNAGRVSPREALAIVPQICDALQYAHDQSIIHRDIKPENILLDRRGRVKVADFGLAKLIGSSAPLTPSLSPSDGERAADRLGEGGKPVLTEAGRIMGTPQYMAPEQFDHPGEVDHRVDIYALGVVFYQMLTGELPAGKVLPPSQRVQVDVRLDEVVLHALEKEPARRYQQVSEVKSAVDTIVQHPGSHFQSLKPGSLRPSWWETRKRAVRIVGKVTAALALALGLGVLILPTSVHVSGVVANALTGRPVANAELTLQPSPGQSHGAAPIPNAWSNKDGRFSFYVRWYAAGQHVAVAAPGYQVLETGLGPKPLGSHRLTRNFGLQPTDFNAQIAQLSQPGTTVEEVIRALGPPFDYVWGTNTFQRANLPATYILEYPTGVDVVVSRGVVVELRSEEPGPGFTWHGKLRLGSSLDEALHVLGPPSDTVVGEALMFDPGVLYKDIDREKGHCYYSRPDQNIRLFFNHYRVCELRVLLPDPMNYNDKQQEPR